MHPAGTFEAAIRDHGIALAQTGTEQVVVKFETEAGFITGFFALTDKAITYTMDKLVAMGYRGQSMLDVNDGKCMLGNRCSITVVHEKYQGETRAKVSFVNPVGWEGAEIRRDEQAARNAQRFDALLRKKVAEAGDSDGEEAPAEDDIPF